MYSTPTVVVPNSPAPALWTPRVVVGLCLVALGAFTFTLGVSQLVMGTTLYAAPNPIASRAVSAVARQPQAPGQFAGNRVSRNTALAAVAQSVYDFTVKDAKGSAVDMANFKGKVLLIVNVASRCGFTPQYNGLQTLQDKYKGKPFSVVAFPCNQFGAQEPGSSTEVCEFAKNRFSATFPIMDKTDVNGDDASPLFQYMKKQQKAIPFKEDVAWNFEKFLVDKDGRVVKRYSSMATPESIEADIEKLL
eukprot:EG_transcript_20841